MGFRNFRNFNLAMLCKQSWRLLENPSSLVARIFKARYYPSSSFLCASLGSNPSFIWRSVFATQEIIRKGICKRIGDGSTTLISSDPWLPCSANPFITSSHPVFLDRFVNSLMHPSELRWYSELLFDLFNPRDVGLILSIPLNASRTHDV